MWKSQLQTKTVTSNMQAETTSCSTCCRELIDIVAVAKEIGTVVGLSTSESTKMHVYIHAFNLGALVLAQTPPPQFTPVNKHHTFKTPSFREQCITLGIVIYKRCTTE